MSGFAGQFNRDGRPTTADDLAPAMAALAHHNREGCGLWYEGPVALSHHMTHVTPESVGETLPYHVASSSLTITGDSRLDNRDELLAALAVPRELWTMPDSQLILRAYERWGDDCPLHLLGDYAFAIWDKRAQRLFCARDFIGAKPFYYHAARGGFYFASDITALLAFPAVSSELNLRYVRTYLEYGRYYHLERSFFEDVRKLPPGHTLNVSAGGLEKRRYWSAADAPKIRYTNDADYVERLRELLDEAVAPRLRSAFPIGAHLSGGLDSSSVAVLAARALHKKGEMLHAFCWAPPPAEAERPLTDERALAEAICQLEGIPLIYTPLGPEGLVALWTRDITRHPEHTLRHELVASRLAAAMGKRVILSGWGGDEAAAFNGRGYFADLFRRGRWVTMSRELALRARLHEDDFWGNVKSRAILPLLPDALLRRARPDLLQMSTPVPFPVEPLQPAFAARLSEAKPYVVEELRERPGVHNHQIRLINYGHLTERLESWAENGGRRGMEYRYPLLDRRVVEFALGVPERLFHYQGWKRYLFRETVGGILPDEVQWNKLKAEYSIARATQEVMGEALRLLYPAMANRRAAIRRAGLLRDDVFLTGIQNLSEDSSDRVLTVAWLALLD